MLESIAFFLVIGIVMCPFLYLVQKWQSKWSGQPFSPPAAWRFALSITALVLVIALVMTWWDNAHPAKH